MIVLASYVMANCYAGQDGLYPAGMSIVNHSWRCHNNSHRHNAARAEISLCRSLSKDGKARSNDVCADLLEALKCIRLLCKLMSGLLPR